MSDPVESKGAVARVSSIMNGGEVIYVEFRNGNTARVSFHGIEEFTIGETVFVSDQEPYLEPAPSELWSNEAWIGVVRYVDDELALIDGNGPLRKIKLSGVKPTEGSTVEVSQGAGVLSVITDKPIRALDIGLNDRVDVRRFRFSPEENLSFDDFGGSGELLERVDELVEVLLKNRENLLKIGVPPVKGILFTGESGTGKTLLGRILASVTGATFYLVKGPEIVGKWLGQSEEVVRAIFEDAKKQTSVVFFDEIDSVAGRRTDDSHEASKRLVAQLLTEMDGFKSDNNVTVMATTNRVQDLDTALLRPGRFDWKIHFELPDKAAREQILKATARGVEIFGELPIEWLAEKTAGWSGADLGAIWQEAALFAVMEDRDRICEEDAVAGYQRKAYQMSKTDNRRAGA